MKIIKNNLRLNKLYLVIILSLFYNDYCPQTGKQVDFNSPVNILKFADYLFCSGDYLRAIDEYNKYLNYNYSDTVIFKTALSFSRIGKNNEAINFYGKLLPHHNFSGEACLEIAKINFFEKNFSNLEKIISDTICSESKYISSIKTIDRISILYKNNPGTDISPQRFSEPFPQSSREVMKDFYERKINTRYKSTLLAAGLSAIVPGSGKIYTGFYADGVSAFLLTGVLGYVSYADFKAHHYFRGWLFGGLAGFFYLGNIYGSAVSAQIRNAQIDFNFKIDLDAFLKKNNFFLPKDDYFCK